MAKIGIIEDSIEDAVFRYQDLTKTTHELYVLFDALRVQPDPFLDKFMESRGFSLQNIRYGLEHLIREPALQQLDYYFCDGLYGGCFEVMEILGRERVWLVTADMNVERQAREVGINVYDRNGRKRLIDSLNHKK